MEFYKTSLGKKFYEMDFPRVVAALEKIATALTTSSTIQSNGEKIKKLETIKENRKNRIESEETVDKKIIKNKLIVERLMQFKDKDGSYIFARDFLNNLLDGIS
jgi:hypothetical protein